MQVRIYYEDTDAAGVVYHANYLKYFERARTEWLRNFGVEQQKLSAESGIGFVVANMQIDFKRGAKLDDVLEIRTTIDQIKGASLKLTQQAFRHNELLVHAFVRIGFVTLSTMQPTPFPEWLKKTLQST